MLKEHACRFYDRRRVPVEAHVDQVTDVAEIAAGRFAPSRGRLTSTVTLPRAGWELRGEEPIVFMSS